MGLKIAVAFTEWGDLENNPEPILDKSFGRIAFYRETYGFDANETLIYKYEELPSHYCTREELNLDKSTEKQENVFFPIASRYEKDMKEQNKKFMCLEPEDTRLQGDFSTNSASLIFIKVEKCQGLDYCKPEEEQK